MCITKNEILELKDVIQNINAIDNVQERDLYLKDAVEDVDLFLDTLKKINKSKLPKGKNKKKECEKSHNYSEEMIIQLFREKTVDDILSEYTKQELAEMYFVFYSKKPLTSFDKKRIALTIYHSIYTIDRTKALLG